MKNKNDWCKTEERYLGEKGWCSKKEYLTEKKAKTKKFEFRKINIKGGQSGK